MLVDFPVSERHLRIAALKIAFSRAGIVISQFLRDSGTKASQLTAALRDVVPGGGHGKEENNFVKKRHRLLQ